MRSHYCGNLRSEHNDQEVTLCGWVRQRRSSGAKLHFMQVDDGTAGVQVVVKKGNVSDDRLFVQGTQNDLTLDGGSFRCGRRPKARSFPRRPGTRYRRAGAVTRVRRRC